MAAHHQRLHDDSSGGGVPWVAIIGVVLAITSLVWQIWNAMRQRPDIRVMYRADVRVGGPDAGTDHRVVVVNNGPQGTTIDDAGFSSVDGSRTVSVEIERRDGRRVEGPPLPARVDGHDFAQWIIPGPQLFPGAGPTEFFAWGQLYVRRRRFTRDELRKIGLRKYKSDAFKRDL